MNEQDITLLDNYFNGLLTETEAQALRLRAAEDADFGRELALRENMEQWLRRNPDRQALSATLAQLGPEYFAENTQTPSLQAGKINWRRWTALAAALAVVGVAIWFVLSPRPTLYRQYAQFAPLQRTERGAADADIQAAEQAFNGQHYAEALPALDRWLVAQPGDPTALLYKGFCLLELNRPAEARVALAPLAEGQSALRADGIWYTGLSYLLENDRESCRRVLQGLAPGEEHYGAAQGLLRKL